MISQIGTVGADRKSWRCRVMAEADDMALVRKVESGFKVVDRAVEWTDKREPHGRRPNQRENLNKYVWASSKILRFSWKELGKSHILEFNRGGTGSVSITSSKYELIKCE